MATYIITLNHNNITVLNNYYQQRFCVGSSLIRASVSTRTIITYCNYKWHCIDHLNDEGDLENLLPNVPLEMK